MGNGVYRGRWVHPAGEGAADTPVDLTQDDGYEVIDALHGMAAGSDGRHRYAEGRGYARGGVGGGVEDMAGIGSVLLAMSRDISPRRHYSGGSAVRDSSNVRLDVDRGGAGYPQPMRMSSSSSSMSTSLRHQQSQFKHHQQHHHHQSSTYRPSSSVEGTGGVYAAPRRPPPRASPRYYHHPERVHPTVGALRSSMPVEPTPVSADAAEATARIEEAAARQLGESPQVRRWTAAVESRGPEARLRCPHRACESNLRGMFEPHRLGQHLA